MRSPCSLLSSPDNRLSPGQVQRLTREAVIITGDDYLGLHQGERFMGLANILGYVLMNCRNLGQALEKLTQYQRLCDEGTAIELEVEGDLARVRVSILETLFADDRHLSDYRLAGIYTYLQRLTGISYQLRAVCLCHPPPPQTSEYERIFQCPLVFASSMNAISFDRHYLDIPLPAPNDELLKKFEQYARSALKAMASKDCYAGRVSRTLTPLLQGRAPTIEAVARALAMSVRGLQLKLQQEETTYNKILNDVRKEMAISYLRDGGETSIHEIAYLLGYSEVSVFYRAFKRWTKATPAAFRRTSSFWGMLRRIAALLFSAAPMEHPGGVAGGRCPPLFFLLGS